MVAGQRGVDRDTRADRDALHPGADLGDLAHELVAEGQRLLELERAAAAVQVVVQVRAADPAGAEPEPHPVGRHRAGRALLQAEVAGAVEDGGSHRSSSSVGLADGGAHAEPGQPVERGGEIVDEGGVLPQVAAEHLLDPSAASDAAAAGSSATGATVARRRAAIGSSSGSSRPASSRPRRNHSQAASAVTRCGQGRPRRRASRSVGSQRTGIFCEPSIAIWSVRCRSHGLANRRSTVLA